jgi:hypothetical protein
MAEQQTYLGDGVYASFEHSMIWLRAERTNGMQEIALAPSVYHALTEYTRRRSGDQARSRRPRDSMSLAAANRTGSSRHNSGGCDVHLNPDQQWRLAGVLARKARTLPAGDDWTADQPGRPTRVPPASLPLFKCLEKSSEP